jgi:hypothetical protein
MQQDILVGPIIHIMEIAGFIDLAPTKLMPTWINMCIREAHISKLLDQYLLFESLLETPFKLRKWVFSRGDLDHYPIL